MNPARAGELPLVPLAQARWCRSVEERYRFAPPFVCRGPTRFNRGGLQVAYFAPDQVLARFEARDVLGHWFGDVHARPDAPLGLTAPSARNPLQDNLILFADRLPPRSIAFSGLLLWHSSLLSARR